MSKYSFYCEPCGYREFLNEEDFKSKIEISRSPIPKGVVKIEDGKATEESLKQGVPQPRMFKCPKCGRGVKVREVANLKRKLSSE